MKTWMKIAAFALLTYGLSSCLKAPEYPDEPVIEFLSVSKSEVVQNSQDSFRLVFSFTDGDGDIGMSDDTATNVEMYDTRTGFLENRYRIPFIPPQGPTNGISGEVTLVVYSSCCIYSAQQACFPNPAVPLDTVVYRLVVRDAAGHFSNEIFTSPIVLRCE